MIALLFTLLTVALFSIWWDKLPITYALFGITILLGLYWLSYHATSQLSIKL